MSSALKWLNQSRCCFGCRLVGPRIHVLGGARIPEGNGQFCWVISQPIMKYKEYVVRAKVISRWQQWCGLLLSVVQQLVHHWQRCLLHVSAVQQLIIIRKAVFRVRVWFYVRHERNLECRRIETVDLSITHQSTLHNCLCTVHSSKYSNMWQWNEVTVSFHARHALPKSSWGQR